VVNTGVVTLEPRFQTAPGVYTRPSHCRAQRVVTWAPPLYGNNLNTSSAQWVFRLGSTGTTAL